jgi:Fe-S-cluster containining protein
VAEAIVKRSRSEDADSALAEVDGIYRALDDRPVVRDCVRRTDCCRFRLTGMVPYLTRGEAMVAARAVRRMGRTKLPQRDDGACPLLDSRGNCLVYDGRPFGCRTHFCAAAGGPYARSEVLDLIRRLEEIDHRLGGDGARPLRGAVAWALRNLP